MTVYDYAIWFIYFFLLTLPWTIAYLPPKKKWKQ